MDWPNPFHQQSYSTSLSLDDSMFPDNKNNNKLGKSITNQPCFVPGTQAALTTTKTMPATANSSPSIASHLFSRNLN
jgi:hypothetical protein